MDPRLSHVGRLLAVASARPHGLFEIWTYDLVRSVEARLTGASYVGPVWSRDGTILAQSPHDIRVVAPGRLESESWTDAVSAPLGVAADGTVLVRAGRDLTTAQLGVMSADGKGQLLKCGPRTGVTSASFSPDGRWVAYHAAEDVRTRVYVERCPGTGSRLAVTGMYSGHPRWRRDGREPFYLSKVDSEYALVAIPISYSSGIPDFGAPRVLFKVPGIYVGNHGLDVTSDGQRFVDIIEDDTLPLPLMIRVRAALSGSQ